MDPLIPSPEGQGTEPTTVPVGGGAEPEAQSTGTEPQAQSQPEGGGQDLIAPYLEGVDEGVRDIVAQTLEKYRQDADRNFNKRFEEVSSRVKAYESLAPDPAQLETPVALYDSLMQDPVGTLDWIAQQFQAELGQDLKAQLLEKWGPPSGQQADPQAQQNDPNDPNRPLTRAEYEQMMQEREQQAAQEREAAEARAKTDKWLTEAASEYNLELGEGDLVLKEAILRQAAQIMPSVRDGQQAIRMATEAIVNRFQPKKPEPAPKDPAPRTANGGSPAPPPEVDYSDKRQRQEAMLAMLQAAQQT